MTKLAGGTGARGARLTAATLRDDAAVDTLVGGAGVDLLFARPAGGTADKLLGRRAASG